MSDASIVAVALFGLLVVSPAVLGLISDRLRPDRSSTEVLLGADNARARATLAYYNEVHDSHSG